MDSSMYSQWVQSQVPESTQHEPNDWGKDRPGPPSSSSPTIDMSEFTTLADLPGSTTTSILATSPQSFYNQYVNSGFFVQAPYNAMAYGTPWPTSNPVPLSNYSSLNGATTSSSNQQQQQFPQQQQQPIQQLQQPPQQPHPSTSQHMTIDPILTINPPNPPFPHSPTYPTQQQQQQSQPSQQTRPQFYNQHVIYPNYFRHQPQPAQQGTLSPQALHSPTNAMMTVMPSNSFQPQTTQSQAQPATSQPQTQHLQSTSIQPAQPQPPDQKEAPLPPVVGLTPEQREDQKRQFQNSIRPLLQPTAFTGAQAVRELADRIADYGVTEVDAATRLEILARIRDGAGNHYYRAWSENSIAIDITREWIKAAAKGNNAQLVETTMPLLHLIDRLPFNVESLSSSKLGRIIKKLVKDEPSPAIKDMASNLERRWRNMISDIEGGAKTPENKGPDDPKGKKRKLVDPVPGKPSQPLKKAALGTAVSTKPTVGVKKEPGLTSITTSKTPSQAVKDAKADSSFFSAPKPKAKLPSFKKASVPVQVKKEESNNIAVPSSYDPFQEVLKSMKTRKDSPAVSTPPATSTPNLLPDSQQGLARNVRKKKSVTWAPDHQLESIKLIEKAIYDDDPVDGTHTGHSLRDLDRGEGAALHAVVFEEVMDWAEPLLIDLSPDSEGQRTIRGSQSEEKATQEEREQSALGALYMTPNQIPDSPSEPAGVIPEEEVDTNATVMTVGPSNEADFFDVPADPNTAAVVSTVADLVGQLAMGSMAMDISPPSTASGVAGQTLGDFQQQAGSTGIPNISQDQLQMLLQQLAAAPGAVAEFGQMSPGYPGAGSDGAWPSHHFQPESLYGHTGEAIGYQEDPSSNSSSLQQSDPQYSRTWEGRGRGRSRGRGRGRGDEGGYRPYIKRKPCSFFAAGRCKYGDQCDFAHDILPEH